MSRHPIKFASGLLLALSIAAGACAEAQTVVFDQIGNNPSIFSSAGYSSQIYDAPYAASTTGLVDDFTLTDPTLLTITNVQAVFTLPTSVFSHPTTANIEGWEVDIYDSKPGTATGSKVLTGDFSADDTPAQVTYTTPYEASVNGSSLVSIPVDFTLPATGTYYIAVLAKNNLSANGTVYMAYTGGTTFFGGGNDFSFTPANATQDANRTGDAAYRISAVPEPGAWALLAAGGFVLAVGGVRRHLRAAAAPLA